MFCFHIKAAVHVNKGGIGEVLLLPYYTVKNGLNTLVTISNTTEQSKAVKVSFRETNSGFYRDAINVYLGPNDTWVFSLAENEDQVQLISQDKSCVPFFNSPYLLNDAIASPSPPGNLVFSEGMIEIYEMGELDPGFGYGKAVTFEDGEVVDCEQIETNWHSLEGGDWQVNDGLSQMLPATGGLMASVSLVNVSSGINYSYDATVLSAFYSENVIIHTQPFSYRSPSLSDAKNTSLVQHQGESVITSWPTGFEAVSAVLMKEQLIMGYSNEVNINAQTEIILTLPTRELHLQQPDSNAPFNQADTIFSDCELFGADVLSRNGQSTYYVSGNVSPLPPILCNDANVVKIWDFYDSERIYDPILDSANRSNQSIFKGSEGVYKVSFLQTTTRGKSVDGTESHVYYGLPVIGLSLIKYTNANAQPGLLAQYGGAFVPKSKQKIEISPGSK